MDRRTFLAVSAGGLGVCSGCSEFFGSESETTGQDPDSTPTGTPGDGQSTGTPAPTVDSINLRATDTAGAVRYSVRASDAEAITALEVASPSDAATRTFDDRTSIHATGTVGAPLGQRSPIIVMVTNPAGNETIRERQTYTRAHPVFEPTAYDVGAVYHPRVGRDGWDCIAGEPSVGEYGSPRADGTLARTLPRIVSIASQT